MDGDFLRRIRDAGFILAGLFSPLMIIGILFGTMFLPAGTEAAQAVYSGSGTDEATPLGGLVVLVHGFARDRDDMKFLEEGLSKRGYVVYTVNLPTTFGSVEDCTASMTSQLAPVIGRYGRIDFVTHSMGALITRSYLKAHSLPGLRRCVFIAPPHKGSAISDFLDHVPFYSSLFQPVKDLKTDSANLGNDLYLIPDTVEVGIIAGSKNDMLAGRLLLSPGSDGRVDVESTRCADMDERVVLPYNHHKIHHNEETLNAVDSFLRNGTFDRLR